MKFNEIFAQLFKDKHGRIIYYRPRTKTAYFIDEKDERKVNAFHHRLILSVAVGAAFYSLFGEQLYYALAIGVLAYLFFSYFFFQKILPNYTQRGNYHLEENLPDKPEQNPTRMFIVGLSYLILSILLIISLFYYDNEPTSKALLIVFSILGIGMGLNNLNQFFRHKK